MKAAPLTVVVALGLAMLLAAPAADPQQADKVPRIGVLLGSFSPGSPN